MYVTREFKFDAAHSLEGYRGDCANLHGHTWRFAVTIEGSQLDKMGMVIDFKYVKQIVNTMILDRLDHKYLNDIIPFNPTAENLAKWIYKELERYFENESQGLFLFSIKLWENYPECYVEYYGD